MRSLNTTGPPSRISKLAFCTMERILTHVQSPTYTFHTAIEAVRKIGVMLDIWMTVSPKIDKLWSPFRRIRSVEDVPERLRFIQRVARSFVPI